MTVYALPPIARATGFAIGILLLDFREPHAPGDTANATTYDFPTIFKTVTNASVEKVTSGDPSVTDSIVAAAKELEQFGVQAISSNCGLMVHYQDIVRDTLDIPVFLSSLLQIPLAARTIRSSQKIGVITSCNSCITPEVLRLAGVPTDVQVVTTSIETSPEFVNMSSQSHDTSVFCSSLEQAGVELKTAHPDLGALVIECASFTPYAASLQRRLELPVYDFVSLIDYAYYVTHRRDYMGV